MKDHVIVQATIVKIGNSQGIRIGRQYLDKIGAKLGDQIEIKSIIKKHDHKKVMTLLRELSTMEGDLQHMQDPVAWQREIRKDRDLPGRQ